jgi:hypothetical protein
MLLKMSEIAQQFECGAVLVQEGLVWPLSPSAHVSDLDLGQLARITEEMSNTGYKVVRDFTNFSGEDSTIKLKKKNQVVLSKKFAVEFLLNRTTTNSKRSKRR